MNELQLTGRLVKICPIESGTSKSNKPWQSLTFVIETEDSQYHELIACVLFGDKVTYIDKFKVGEMITVKFSIKSREFNGRYFTSVSAYSVSPYQETTFSTTGSPNNYSSAVKDNGLPQSEMAWTEKDKQPEPEEDNLPF